MPVAHCHIETPARLEPTRQILLACLAVREENNDTSRPSPAFVYHSCAGSHDRVDTPGSLQESV